MIEKNAWVGANVTILKGVKIGEGAVVGAGSLIVKEVPPYSVCVGNPAKPIKLRFNQSELTEHLKAVGSNYNGAQVVEQFENAIKN